MRLRRLCVAVTTTLAVSLAVAATAVADPTFAPADSADVRPGSMTFTAGGQCTSNFVFFDAADDLYIGQAAHCAGTGWLDGDERL